MSGATGRTLQRVGREIVGARRVTRARPEPWLVDRVRACSPPSRTVALDDAALRRAVQATGVVLDQPALTALVGALRDELRGLGALEPLVRDPAVTDVLVNAPDDVWIDRGTGWSAVPVGVSRRGGGPPARGAAGRAGRPSPR